jgi:hypothetical protein
LGEPGPGSFGCAVERAALPIDQVRNATWGIGMSCWIQPLLQVL